MKSNFLGTNLKYFAVSSAIVRKPTASQLLINELLSKATQHDKQHEQQLRIVKEASHVTLTPWLRRTGWSASFLGKNMLALSETTAKPTAAEGGLMNIWNSVERTIRRSLDSVKDCNARGWHLILFWLVSPRGDQEASQPFRQHFAEGTVTRYIGYWQRFICFCLRMLDNSEEFGVQFRNNQRNKLCKLRAMVELDNVIEEELDKEVTAVLKADFRF